MPLQELDLVAAIEKADLGGTNLVRAVQQPNQAIPDLAALVALERPDARLGEGHGGCVGHHAKRIGPADLLQRRPPPAWQLRLIHDPQALRSARVHPGGRRGGQERVGLGIVSVPAALAEDHESGPGHTTCRRRGDRRHQLDQERRQRGVVPGQQIDTRLPVDPDDRALRFADGSAGAIARTGQGG